MRLRDYENAHMQKVLVFKELLEKKLELPVVTEDERLSTKMARGLGGRRSKEKCDDVAAMLILQSYLDKQ
jgi:putative Holliday junction resolvase